MSDNAHTDDAIFEVMTPLGFRVRVSCSRWKLIITVKHPVMAGRELDVKKRFLRSQTKFDSVAVTRRCIYSSIHRSVNGDGSVL